MIRTLVRLYLTKRNLLEWVTAAQAAGAAGLNLRVFYRHLRWSVILAAVAGALFVALKPGAWPVAAPFVLLWMSSPVLAWRISVPARMAQSQVLTPGQTHRLRLIARRTWRFFETFVDERNHSLPPDNFQEDPTPVEARRTSPTNMGIYLLGTIAARDFGWIGTLETVERLEATLHTMSGLRRVRGHFLNWYDTRDLRPLEPMYVSTVDSGNLGGYLITLAQACREHAHRPAAGPEFLEGIGDSLRLLFEAMKAVEHSPRAQTVTTAHLREAARAVAAALEEFPSAMPERLHRLQELESRADTLLDIARTLAGEIHQDAGSGILIWAGAVHGCVKSHARDIRLDPLEKGLVVQRLTALATIAEEMAQAMDFQFLFEPTSRLFSIGYRVADGTLDPGRYDLLASEARLASFLAIAKGDVPPQHWFHLGRSLTPIGHGAALVSWSGSMFEYLMPLLVMSQPAWSLLDLTCRLVVRRQIRYGSERGVPWGVSESAYNVRDAALTYQYAAFGVPGLGLKRGLFEDVVVAPYATALAAMIDPGAALENFRRLEQAGARGAYGFYEALDYTPSRLPERTAAAVVRAYMAHHQGMVLIALGNVLSDGLTPKRFHSHPMFQAAELLLQERTPRAVSVTRPRAEEVHVVALVRDLLPPTLRRFDSPHDITPRTHLLANGRYTVMVTAAGSGFSRWRDIAVTRWREDTTRDCWGTFFFLRDAANGRVWSAGFHPIGHPADSYEVVYSEDRARIVQRDRSLSITLEVVVSTEDDAELRRLTVTNLENRDREIDVTSYAEIVLAPQAADQAHPAFSNLFVETEFVARLGALLATRRPRAADEARIWLAHLAALEGETLGTLQYESDRARFLGRGRGVRLPISVMDGGPLTNTTGSVLDPIVSLRHRVVLPAQGTVRLVYTTLVARSRDEALLAAEKYQQPATFERESTLAWTRAQVQLHHLRITQDEAHLFQRLANRLLYADSTLRAAPQVLAANRRGPSGLWSFGISGDLPIAMVRIEQDEQRDVVRQLLRAHEYWGLKGVPADLVILNARGASYAQDLQHSIEAMVQVSRPAAGGEADGNRGRVFILREDLLSPHDVTLLHSAARVLIQASRGSLSEQAIRLERAAPVPQRPRAPRQLEETISAPALDLEFFN
ncbi:MAG TPA: glucoamylase family protein, partial [Candidatus Polarisedimenticolia bacterium]|nr:glucoamylase family protein [Candidatus Polarisedimenticolia bacterium]